MNSNHKVATAPTRLGRIFILYYVSAIFISLFSLVIFIGLQSPLKFFLLAPLWVFIGYLLIRPVTVSREKSAHTPQQMHALSYRSVLTQTHSIGRLEIERSYLFYLWTLIGIVGLISVMTNTSDLMGYSMIVFGLLMADPTESLRIQNDTLKRHSALFFWRRKSIPLSQITGYQLVPSRWGLDLHLRIGEELSPLIFGPHFRLQPLVDWLQSCEAPPHESWGAL